jgi:putative ABC transport system substrate-binding protein
MRNGIARRDFITILGGAAAAWPLTSRAQQERIRRVGVLINLAADDPEASARVIAFRQALQGMGWTDRNIRFDIRWGAADDDQVRRSAAELLALSPEVILAGAGNVLRALLQVTRSVPIVFAQTADPVGNGYVASLAHPGGNATGFSQFEFSMSGKWLELLKEIAPHVSRVGVFRDQLALPLFGAIQAVAPIFGVEVTPLAVSDANEIERDVTAFARQANGGLIVTATVSTAIHREQIIGLAAQHRLPAIYPFRYMAVDGGLVSYGPDVIDQFRRAAGYVDRILKGEKPGDLPVQAPTKYELLVNLKTAKALGLAVPPTLLVRADEVIE